MLPQTAIPLEAKDIGLKNPGLILKHSRLAVPGLGFNVYTVHRLSEKTFKDAGVQVLVSLLYKNQTLSQLQKHVSVKYGNSKKSAARHVNNITQLT